MVILIWAISAAVGLAAGEEEAPQFVVLVNEDVKPEAMETYMKTKIGKAQLCRQYQWEIPHLTFVQDFRVTTCYVFNAFAQIDEMPMKIETQEGTFVPEASYMPE